MHRQSLTEWNRRVALSAAQAMPSAMAANESAMEDGPLHKFVVTIGPRNAPRVRMEVMARSSAQATQQHVDMCEIGERLEVIAA